MEPERAAEAPRRDVPPRREPRPARRVRRETLFTPALVVAAIRQAFVMLRPDIQWKNPVMFVVEIGAFVTLLFVAQATRGGSSSQVAITYLIALDFWLFVTVLFANFATALAEERGKAQAESLRRTRRDTPAFRLSADGNGEIEQVSSTALQPGDAVLVLPGQIIPSDGEIIEGIATVDESAITGESAPVIREAGGDRSGVTGGTLVLSDRIVVRVTAHPGESFLDQMIALVEGAVRQRTPNEIALTLVLTAFTLIFMIVVVPLWAMAWNAERYMTAYLGLKEPIKSLGTDVPTLVALLVCLIPTTIGGLLAAIGIAGMDRALSANVIAKSGRAVEVAGDVDTLLLDKTGTITIGNRRATAFIPIGAYSEAEVGRLAALASVADETPEGKSIVALVQGRSRIGGDPARRLPLRSLHGPDSHERDRPSRRPARPQGLVGGGDRLRGATARPRAARADPDGGPGRRPGSDPAGRGRRQRDRGRGGPRGHPEARHPGALRAVAAHGAAHRHDHR